MSGPHQSVSLAAFLWRGGVLLWSATVLVPFAVVLAPFIAFGIVMTPRNGDNLVVSDYAVLWPLGIAVVVAVASLATAWWFEWSAPHRVATATRSTFALIALVSGLTVILGFV